MNAPVRVGIVGAGYVATHHLRALRDLPFIKLTAICDQDRPRAGQMAARFGVERVCASLAEMASLGVDVIHVLTPPASHCALTLEALDMGCHVFVEKPMADTPEECDRMIEKARQKGLTLSVDHSARFDPVVLEAIDVVRRGQCGDVFAVHFIRSSDYPPYAGGPLPAPYRQGSYPFRDLGVHGLYMMEQFLGPVRALRARHLESGRDPMLTFDEWRADVDCESGTGYMFLSWNSRPMQNELWIQGTRGTLHVDCFLQICDWNRVWPGPKSLHFILNGFFNSARKVWRVPWNMARFATGRLKPSPGIYRAVQDFHRALRAGEPVPVQPEEARRAIAFISQASAAADAGKQRRLETELTRPLAPAKVLVTGGAGFLGRALVERLRAQGESVRLLLRRADGSDNVIHGSLGQPEIVDRAVEGVEIVYHVGAAMKGGPAEFEQGTIWGTRNIIEACLRHKVKRLVYVSSLGVLDHAGHADGVVVKETSPLDPYPERRGAYTQTKLRAERMVIEAIERQGLPAVILRPGQIFGPGAETVTPNGVISLAGQWLVAGRGNRRLPLVYRDDVVDAILLASSSAEAPGQIVNLVDTTTPITQNDYLRAAQPAIAGKFRVRRVPVWLLMWMAIGVELLGAILKRGAPLSRYRVRSLKPLYPFDCSRAAELLGWKPLVGVKEGLRRTFSV
jgi:2-alkyl-3-oxoalkanoate reductase